MKKVLLLDGYNLIYRARYSGMSKGDYSTVFNFFRGIRPLVEKFSPDICYFVLEGRPTARLDVSPDYKGQRVYHNDDNFSEQRREIINTIKSNFPFIVARHKNYECDDVINFLANEKHKDDKTTIISSDTDFIQSINKNNDLYNPVSKKFIEPVEYDYVEWKSLVGDKSDNIEGFKGIGNKRAIALLSDRTKLEQFLLQENNQESFDKNKFMIKFHTLTNDEKDITMNRPEKFEWTELREKFNNMQFKSMTDKDKTWDKYKNTFANLERNLSNVSWSRIRKSCLTST